MHDEPKMTCAEVQAFLNQVFPQIDEEFRIVEVGVRRASAEIEAGHAALRPGGTVSGPTMFALADLAFYAATLAMIGPQALTVTANATINFLRKPPPGTLRAEARVLKLGRSLSVGDVMLYSAAREEPVAHATLTYAIP